MLNLLFIGDVVGRPGRQAVQRLLPRLVDRCQTDLVITNGENAAAGFGLTRDTIRELLDAGVDVLTTGNHVWDKREIIGQIDDFSQVLRPLNYPGDAPGRGSGIFCTSAGHKVGVLNLEGRVFMNALECPFRAADRALEELRRETSVVVVDFHAEATSEKVAMGHYLDGRASLVVGTHTHVPTADTMILPGGTGYQTDVGMTGSRDSVIGMRKELVVQKFLSQMPVRFEVAKKDPWLCGVHCRVERSSGRAVAVERVMEQVD